MNSFDFQPRTRVIFGAGSLARLPETARELGFGRTLLVADRGLVSAGHAAEVERVFGRELIHYHDFEPNPDTAAVENARRFAAGLGIQSILALGGGSSMDLAKALNIVLHHDAPIEDFHGYGKCERPLAPMIAIPTTAGTGSEAQSYAIIARADSHLKMAIGDPGLAFRAAILDPALTLSQPAFVTATAGYDAISHAVESYVTTRRNPISSGYAREAWRLLELNFERVIADPQNLEARAGMLAGAHLAGAAIENSMLGATHACANPLTARFNIVHGAAIAMMLPLVVRWNQPAAEALYRELHSELAARLEELRAAAGLNRKLQLGDGDLNALSAAAAEQWTGRFNPRPFDAEAAQQLYRWAAQ